MATSKNLLWAGLIAGVYAFELAKKTDAIAVHEVAATGCHMLDVADGPA